MSGTHVNDDAYIPGDGGLKVCSTACIPSGRATAQSEGISQGVRQKGLRHVRHRNRINAKWRKSVT